MQEEKFYSLPAAEHYYYRTLAYAQQFPYLIALNNCGQLAYRGSFPKLIAWSQRELPLDKTEIFKTLKQQYNQNPSCLFGYLGYDLKNEIYQLDSRHPNALNFPLASFFEAQLVIEFHIDGLLIKGCHADLDALFRTIIRLPAEQPEPRLLPIEFNARLSKQEYIHKVNAVRQHILEGDCYELNLCQEFVADNVELNPTEVFTQLNTVSPAPFSAFYKHQQHYILSASPERFIKKEGRELISQPIKGTAPRGANAEEDELNRQQLARSEKERAENMMIVDLVRNDLARSSVAGSVQVPELFKIYTFPQVHQMISTVSSTLRKDVHPIDALKWAFPMGSMTGAPKKKVMELIEQYECSWRGPYSGGLGYLCPTGDFDFNVLIRSLFYHQGGKKLSFQVGGAITWDSEPEAEYQECLTKASGLLRALGASIRY